MGLLVLVPHLFHDADKILQTKHIASVWPVVNSGVIPEALKCAVCKVDHADIHLGWRGGASLKVGAAWASAGTTRWWHLREPHVHVLKS